MERGRGGGVDGGVRGGVGGRGGSGIEGPIWERKGRGKERGGGDIGMEEG